MIKTMINQPWVGAVVCLALVVGCRPQPESEPSNPPAVQLDDQPPVAINAVSPVQYPPALFEQKVEGNVVLQLYVDETGAVDPDSTIIVETSGYPALDSAALMAAAELEFAPAIRRGEPVAVTFLQPIYFRHPEGAEPDVEAGDEGGSS